MKLTRVPRRVLVGLAIGATAALTVALAVLPARAGSGDPDVDNEYPEAGAIVVIDPAANPDAPAVVGSGVLIHPRVMLTAGHVTAPAEAALAQGVPVQDVSRISFGRDATDPTTWVEWTTVLTHPGYQPEHAASLQVGQDLGVVILKRPVDLPCATLPYEGFLDDLKAAGLLRRPGVDRRFAFVGYGNTLTFPPATEHLSDGLRRVAFPAFEGLADTWVHLNQNQAAGNTGGASGDSGGPLYWLGRDGGRVVVGVHSRCDPERAGRLVDCRLDTAAALDFIGLVIWMVEAGMFD